MPAISRVECVKVHSAQQVLDRYRRLSLYPQQMRSYAVRANFWQTMLWETDEINGFVHNFSTAPNLDFEHLNYQKFGLASRLLKIAFDFFNVLRSGRYSKSFVAFEKFPTPPELMNHYHVQSPAQQCTSPNIPDNYWIWSSCCTGNILST